MSELLATEVFHEAQEAISVRQPPVDAVVARASVAAPATPRLGGRADSGHRRCGGRWHLDRHPARGRQGCRTRS